MQVLFGLIFFVCMLALIIGLIKPKWVVRFGDVEKRTRKKVLLVYGLGLIIAFAGIGMSTESQEQSQEKPKTQVDKSAENKEDKTVNKDKDTKKEEPKKEEAKKDNNDVEKFQEKREKDLKSYETGITYDQIARKPDMFKGKKIQICGNIIQILEADDHTEMLLQVGETNDTVHLMVPKKLTKVRFLEKDKILVRGISKGLITYQSSTNVPVTIPRIDVDYIDQCQE